jgi:hypothetical protein
LANHLYNQLEKEVQFADRSELARRALPPSEPVAHLKGLMGHRHELVHECTRRKNKLTALCDQLFPELPQVFRDPNTPTALRVRERYPTAAAVAKADPDELWAVKGRTHPGRKQLAYLQTLAAPSIGVRDPKRLEALVFEQEQLIHELQLLERHLEEIECREEQILLESREGRILRSIPGIGVHAPAAILAAIGVHAPAAILAAIGNLSKLSHCGRAQSLLRVGSGHPSIRGLCQQHEPQPRG